MYVVCMYQGTICKEEVRQVLWRKKEDKGRDFQCLGKERCVVKYTGPGMRFT